LDVLIFPWLLLQTEGGIEVLPQRALPYLLKAKISKEIKKVLQLLWKVFRNSLTAQGGFRLECHTYSVSYTPEVENQTTASTFAEALRNKYSAH
jgi:hypothetical protein